MSMEKQATREAYGQALEALGAACSRCRLVEIDQDQHVPEKIPRTFL